MTLDELKNEWIKDAPTKDKDLLELFHENSYMSHKYLGFYADENLKLIKLKTDLKILKNDLRQYYEGQFSEEDLKKYNLKQWQRKLLKTEIENYVETNELYVKMNLRLCYQETIVEFLKEIISQIKYRDNRIGRIQKQVFFNNGVDNV